jgi:hypothetical protein
VSFVIINKSVLVFFFGFCIVECRMLVAGVMPCLSLPANNPLRDEITLFFIDYESQSKFFLDYTFALCTNPIHFYFFYSYAIMRVICNCISLNTQ